MMIRAVLFDAVGTLIDPHPPVAVAYQAAGRRHGSRRTREEIEARFRAALAREERAGDGETSGGSRAASTACVTSAEQEQERWRRIVGWVLDDASDPEALFQELWHHFARARAWRLFADVRPAWSRLRETGCRLGIASNFDDRLERVCRALPPLSEADAVLHSAGLGYAKPDARFYRQAALSLDLPPAEILFVGDNRQLDYAAPRKAGFPAVWLRRDPEKTGTLDAASPGESITSLEQIVTSGYLAEGLA